MRNLLGAAALLATGVFASGAANAASLPDAASLSPQAQQGKIEQIDFRGYRHCHGPRWDRVCHGGGRMYFRDRFDRWPGTDYDGDGD